MNEIVRNCINLGPSGRDRDGESKTVQQSLIMLGKVN